jgi:hypothetical protein
LFSLVITLIEVVNHEKLFSFYVYWKFYFPIIYFCFEVITNSGMWLRVMVFDENVYLDSFLAFIRQLLIVFLNYRLLLSSMVDCLRSWWTDAGYYDWVTE